MKKTLFLFVAIVVVSVVFPTPLFAAICTSGPTPATFTDLVCLFTDLAETAIPVVAGLALVVFFWGLAKFILHSGDEKGREEGKEVMKWGIIALFVLVSIWGIVFFLTRDIFGENLVIPRLPPERVR